jgi:hypothetical protein
MATYSTSLNIKLITDGTESGTWGNSTNTNWNLIEQAVAGVQAITMINADYTLTVVNGASDEARNAVLVVSGTNSAVRKIVAPLVPKVYMVFNNTTGSPSGYAITIGGSTGSVATIPNGVTCLVYCDGTSFYNGTSGSPGNFSIAGNETVSGNLTVSGAATVTGTVTGGSFTGAGTGLTGTAAALSIGGNAATATSATSATTATTATSATTAGYITNSAYNGYGLRTVSSSAPTSGDGSNGDIWYKV